MDVSLLLSIGPDESVDGLGLDLVNFIEGTFNLYFIGTRVDEEDEGVAFGHGLVGFFGIERVDED